MRIWQVLEEKSRCVTYKLATMHKKGVFSAVKNLDVSYLTNKFDFVITIGLRSIQCISMVVVMPSNYVYEAYFV